MFPLGVKLETINVKIKELKITKEKDTIEIALDETVPDNKKGVILLRGLTPGEATVTKDDESVQLNVSEDGILTVDGVSPGNTVKISR